MKTASVNIYLICLLSKPQFTNKTIMLDILQEGKLNDGRNFRIIRIVTPENNIPSRIIRYFMASFSYEKYRQYSKDQAYWRMYYREALDGHTAQYVEDRHYLAEIEGQFASRVWFAYNKKSGFGNFGNVYTETEFRCLGIMSKLLKPCAEDFQASSAKMLCCSTGTDYAANSYRKVGFDTIYGGVVGPMCISKVDFFQEEARQFPGDEPLTVRSGNPGDQFDIDKFLAYTKAMYGHKRNHHVGASALIPDYRTAFQEVLSDNGFINVAETPSGAVAGFAYAINLYGTFVMDFTLHFAYMAHGVELLRRTADDFASRFGEAPLIYIHPEDSERLELLRQAGFKEVAFVPGQFHIFN